MMVRSTTLEQVVEHYDHGGVDRPSRSDLMKPLGLTVAGKIRTGRLPEYPDQQSQSDRRAGPSPLKLTIRDPRNIPCARLFMFALVVLSGLSAGALAANQAIHQQGRVFSSESVTIKKGEALTFVNDDSVPHNICRPARATSSISARSRPACRRM